MMFAFPHQEVVIAAAVFFGMHAAQRRARFIDRAAAQLAIEKLATALIDAVFFVAQNEVFVIRLIAREFGFGLFISQAVMFGEPFDVGLGDFDPVISAAITGAF